MTSRKVQFHQALHGYNDGHRLLQASRKLPSEVGRLMLVLSDMSGPSMVRGFESYLTGYPLTEIKSYALARTWYAPEMERPGCVWTHTLIISNTDLAHVGNLWALVEFFIRPARESSSWNTYSEPLAFLSEELIRRSRTFAKPLSQELCRTVSKAVEALYEEPSSQVFLPLERVTIEYEHLTTALWSQQWARLRRNFKFCTGAISNRKFPGSFFDWQIIPTSSIREVMRETTTAVFIKTSNQDASIQEDAVQGRMWLKITVADLCIRRQAGLRRFLMTFGLESAKGREDFAPLADIYALILRVKKGEKSVTELIEAVAKLLPSPEEGKRLKVSLFGSSEASTTHSVAALTIPEGDLLKSLASTEHHASYDPEALSISARAATFAISDNKYARSIAYSLLMEELTPIGEKFIDGFCEGILSSTELDLPYEQFELIYQLIRREPKLIAFPTIWRGEEYEQRKIFQYIVTHLKPSNEEVSDMVAAMLNAGSDAVARDVAFEYSGVTVETILDWCNSKTLPDILTLQANWKRTLAGYPELCIRWLKKNSKGADGLKILLASLLDPNSFEVVKGGAALWVEISRKAGSMIQEDDLTAVMTFLLGLGFNGSDNQAINLVINSFETVYVAAETNQLSDVNWRLLSRHAPTISWGRDWDKCERLRGALVDHFVSYHWPPEDFLKCLKNTKIFESVVIQVSNQGGWFNRQRKYLQKISEQVLKGKLKATRAQFNILAANFTYE